MFKVIETKEINNLTKCDVSLNSKIDPSYSVLIPEGSNVLAFAIACGYKTFIEYLLNSVYSERLIY